MLKITIKGDKMSNKQVTISAPNFQTAVFRIRGTTPYVQNKFSKKAREAMRETQKEGSTAEGKRGRGRKPKDFALAYEESKHVSDDGWCGMPASAFRNGMVSACRVAGFQMTRAKLSVFVEADGFDIDDQTPLIKIIKGEPRHVEHTVRLQGTTTDIRAHAMWSPGWEATVRIRFDADQFTVTDVSNLLMRVGMQVGIGEGRPDSKTSTGMGWGLFEIVNGE